MDFTPLPRGFSARKQRIEARIAPGPAPWLFLLGGVHGDEIEGMDVLARLLSHLEKEVPKMPWGALAIPCLNPDGLADKCRLNGNGVDLNRNLPSEGWSPQARGSDYNPGRAPLSEPENVFLDELLQTYPPGLIISFHSWKPLINYNGACREVAEFLGKRNGYPVCADIEGHPTPGSLGEYGPERYNCPVLTLEFPLLKDGHTLDHIWQINGPGLVELMSSDILRTTL